MRRTGFVHQALAYDSDEAFLAGTEPYVRDGLADGDAVLAVVKRQNIALLRDALGNSSREVEFIDSDHWYGYPSRTLGQYHAYCTEHGRTAAGGPRRVRVIGEPVWSRRGELETREWMRYESLLNVAFARSGHWIVCPYDRRALSEQVLTAAARTHPELLHGRGGMALSGAYAYPEDFCAESDADALEPAPEPAREVLFDRGGSVVARYAAAEFARRGGLSEERVGDVMSAVHESALNALRFGGGRAVLRLWSRPSYLVFEIADSGANAPVGPRFPGHLPPAPQASSGHGMWVARQLSDLLEQRIARGGSVVRMHFRA
ncbi:sensor histidine kinase [Streptomyces beijiangensis]|uniref:Sensor histidine kinase n=1 Tax=Streptomyces beijiangensis TaxID=163361 RepID=A0A939F773_9ACTN|nr:sensor histidine kinase [Streptomyces beijiangensis]MBO0512849.1 sensor histidine kinase [Streptomyces beijiangensis]